MKSVAIMLLAAWVMWTWSDERLRWEAIEEYGGLETCMMFPRLLEEVLKSAPPLEGIEDPHQREGAAAGREGFEAMLAKMTCLPVGVTPTTPPVYQKTTPYPVRPKL